MPKNRMKFLNTYLDNITMKEAVEYIDEMIKTQKKDI